MLKKVNIGRTLIIGDSYSTFYGYIPEEYDFWYSSTVNKENGVLSVDKTWWKILFSKINCELIRNDSFSGSTVCHTGYEGKDASNKSFITRVRNLIRDGFFVRENINTVLVFGGTNDSWANVPLGEFKLDAVSEKELYSALPAVYYLAWLLRDAAPAARIIFIINPMIRKEITDAFFSTAEHFGCEALLLSQIEVLNGHPTEKGMREMAEQIFTYLNK